MASQRVALVTGAGSGIGKSAALALLKDGYHAPPDQPHQGARPTTRAPGSPRSINKPACG